MGELAPPRPTERLSIVLPAYNEEGSIERAVQEAVAAASRLADDHEVVVVDDGSRDGTAALLAQLEGRLGGRLRVITFPENRGYGAALREGFRATRGELVFYTDSDNQFDLGELAAFLPPLAEADVVLGYRVNRQDPLGRRVASRFFNGLCSLVFGLGVRDINCSFKLFRGPLIRALPIASDDFFVDTEVLARLRHEGRRIVERPVRHLPRTAGRSKVRAGDVWRTLAAIPRTWLRLRQGSGPAAARGPLGALALTGAVAVALAYQVDRPLKVLVGSGLVDTLRAPDLQGPEGGFRWSGATGAVTVPEPGPGRRMRVEVDLQAWRPRGVPPPVAWVEAGEGRARARATTEPQTVVLHATTAGAWTSDLEVRVRSEVFTPGGGDARPLGVRVREVRAIPEDAGRWPRGVPLRPLALVAAFLPLLFRLLGRAGLPRARARFAGLAAAALLGLSLALFRAPAAALLLPLLATAAALEALLVWAPASVGGAGRVIAASARALGPGRRALSPLAAAALAVASTLALVTAYAARPRLEIDLLSRSGAAVSHEMGPQAEEGGQHFRHLYRTSAVDLRDFGSGSWRLRARLAAGAATPRQVALLRAGGREATGSPDASFTTVELETPSPLGVRSGLLVDFPAAGLPQGLRLQSLELERGRSLPSPFALCCVLGAAFLLAASVRIAGGGTSLAGAAATLAVAALVAALWQEPVATIPFLPTAFGIAAVSACLAAVLAGALRVRASSSASQVPALPAGAVVAVVLAFAAFWTSTAYPLYRGGHFVFHSSIAEEIWRGQFLLFYLPFPGSILTRQAQWGNVVMPHPCLYQVLVSPLAALPHAWFYLIEKGVLALLLAMNVALAALLAQRASGPGAAVFAAILAAGIPASYQLLGLGHLMTILGCWAFALAFAFLILRFDRLPARRAWLGAAALLTLCFLSYFGALVFAAFVLGASALALRRRHPGPTGAMVRATFVAAVAAFLLYYIHWTWPFLRESIPRLLGAAGPAEVAPGSAPAAVPVDVLGRIARIPWKLEYTFGSSLVPLAGLLGLGLARGSAARVLLVAWGGILVLFSGLDLFFNFLLKHHYFTIVPVAVGGGLLLAALAEKGRAFRWAACGLALLVLVFGARMAFEAAAGGIP